MPAAWRGPVAAFAALLLIGVGLIFVDLSEVRICLARSGGPYNRILQPPPAELAAAAAAPGIRVLAVITGGWSLPQFATDERHNILNRQLQNYVQACELVRQRGTHAVPPAWQLKHACRCRLPREVPNVCVLTFARSQDCGMHVMLVAPAPLQGPSGCGLTACLTLHHDHQAPPDPHPPPPRATTCTWC